MSLEVFSPARSCPQQRFRVFDTPRCVCYNLIDEIYVLNCLPPTVMTVVVNGTPHEVPDTSTLAELVALLGLDQATVVAEVSGEIVPPEAFGTTQLKPHDRVELVRFVGGG